MLPVSKGSDDGRQKLARACHVFGIVGMIVLVFGTVGWLQVDGARTRRRESKWLAELGLPTVGELDALIPNRHHLWARPEGAVFGRSRGRYVRNAFAEDLVRVRTWEALCPLDSDGDGATNGEELGDPCCDGGDTWTRRWNLTHPSWRGQHLTEAQLAEVAPARSFPKRRRRERRGPLPLSSMCSPRDAASDDAARSRHESQFVGFYYMRHASDLIAKDSQRSLKVPALALILSCLGRWCRSYGLLEDVFGLGAFRARDEGAAGRPLSRASKGALLVFAYFWTDLVAGLTHLTFDFAPCRVGKG